MKLGAHDVRRVAVESTSDPRTVSRYLDEPEGVRSTSRARIEAALVKLGLARPVPDAGRR